MSEINGPAPHPCESCPYRRDVPSGVWAKEEYEKLLAYDNVTSEQPTQMFQCHQNMHGDDRARLCAGWVGTHGAANLLSVRLAYARDRVPASVFEYETDTPLFGSGLEAAAHGIREIDYPSGDAARVIHKISSRRSDLEYR